MDESSFNNSFRDNTIAYMTVLYQGQTLPILDVQILKPVPALNGS